MKVYDYKPQISCAQNSFLALVVPILLCSSHCRNVLQESVNKDIAGIESG